MPVCVGSQEGVGCCAGKRVAAWWALHKASVAGYDVSLKGCVCFAFFPYWLASWFVTKQTRFSLWVFVGNVNTECERFYSKAGSRRLSPVSSSTSLQKRGPRERVGWGLVLAGSPSLNHTPGSDPELPSSRHVSRLARLLGCKCPHNTTASLESHRKHSSSC